MSNASGAGNKSVQASALSSSQNLRGDARPTPTRRPAPFMLRILKIVGTVVLALLFFRLLGLFGILIVALGIIGFVYIDRGTTRASQRIKHLIATGIVSRVAKLIGSVLAIGGAIVVVMGIMRSSLQPIEIGVGIVVAGILVWLLSYRLR